MARKPAFVSISSAINTRKAELRSLRDDLAKVEKNRHDFDLPMAEVNAVMQRAALYETVRWPNARMNVWSDNECYRDLHLDASFSINCDSMKEGAVPAICQFIMDIGYNPASTDDYCSENYATRTFRFTKKIGDVSIRLNFTAEPREDSPTCRKVCVGEEVKVVPKYEIVCE